MIGDCDDEGTLFSLSTLNITYVQTYACPASMLFHPDIITHRTTSQLKEYIQTIWLPAASSDVVDQLLTLYPEDITQGSPFDTGTLNALSPQSKRIAVSLAPSDHVQH